MLRTQMSSTAQQHRQHAAGKQRKQRISTACGILNQERKLCRLLLTEAIDCIEGETININFVRFCGAEREQQHSPLEKYISIGRSRLRERKEEIGGGEERSHGGFNNKNSNDDVSGVAKLC